MKKFIENAKETVVKARETISAKFPYSKDWKKKLIQGALVFTVMAVPTLTNAAAGDTLVNGFKDFAEDLCKLLLKLVPTLTGLFLVLHLLGAINADEHALAGVKRKCVITGIVGACCMLAVGLVSWYYGYF